MGLYIPYRNFSFVRNSTPFWLNIMEIQELKIPHNFFFTNPYIWNVMSLHVDVFGCEQISHWKGIKYNGILHPFNVR